MKFFKEKLNRQLDLSSQLEFVNFWYIMIVVNDVMTIIGSGLKIRIENKAGCPPVPSHSLFMHISIPLCLNASMYFVILNSWNQESTQYEVCGVLLGTGNLLVWFGVLRYLGFFEKYNVSNVILSLLCPSISDALNLVCD